MSENQLNRENLRYLLPGMGILVALVIAGVLCAYLAWADLIATQQLASRTGQERSTIHRKLLGVHDEAALLHTQAQTYQRLKARGILGEERRLDWVELLKRVQTERQLYPLDYEISPQAPLDVTALSAGPAYQFMVSRMQLRLPLLHEGDLLRRSSKTCAIKRPRTYVCAVAQSGGRAHPIPVVRNSTLASHPNVKSNGSRYGRNPACERDHAPTTPFLHGNQPAACIWLVRSRRSTSWALVQHARTACGARSTAHAASGWQPVYGERHPYHQRRCP